MSAVFVFDAEGDLSVFASIDAAAGWMEAVDVDAGEYAAAFLHDGTVVDMSIDRERVVLTPTGERDAAHLNQLVNEYQQRVGKPGLGGSALDYSNEWLRAEWEQRWPKRPAWLAKRLHGDQPPQVSDDKR